MMMTELQIALLIAGTGLLMGALGYVLARLPRARAESALQAEKALLADELTTQQQKLAAVNAELNTAQRELATLSERHRASSEQYELRIKELKDARETLGRDFENLANRIFDAKQEKFAQQSKQTLDTTLDPVRRELKEFRKKVEDAYDKESAERNKLVGQIAELQKQAVQISSDAANLATALKGDSKMQGNWGEVVLERILEESGLRKGYEYETQLSFTDDDGKRRMPDVVIRLPDKRDIVVDAKVSLTDYERYCSEESAERKQQHLRAHLASIRSHISGLSRKAYENLEGINTLDFVLIFVPIEGAFMLALENDRSLFSDAYDQGIILVSPSTLLATLHTINNIWRFEDQNRNAERIAEQGGKLYDQFVLLVESMDDVGRHLDRTQTAWETATKRLHSGRGNLVKRVEDIKKLGARSKKQLPDTHINRAIENDESGESTALPVDTQDA